MFERRSEGVPDQERAMGLLDTMPGNHKDVVWPQIQRKKITFQRVRDILIKQYGSNAYLDAQRDLFLHIEIQDNETLEAFADRYLLTAQKLIGAGSLSNESCRIAMAHAVRTFSELSNAMTHTLAVETDHINIANFLRRATLTLKVEDIWRQIRAKKNRESRPQKISHSDTNNNRPKRPFEHNGDYCEKCRRKGHKTADCYGKRPRPTYPGKASSLGKAQAN